MSISRRFFLKSGTMTALAASLAVGAGDVLAQKSKQARPNINPTNSIPYETAHDALLYYTRAAFDPCVGSVFQATGRDGHVVDLTLISVTQYETKAATRITTAKARATDSFSLMFKASQKISMISQTPPLTHPVLGKLELFLTERVVNGEIFYEAVINHLL